MPSRYWLPAVFVLVVLVLGCENKQSIVTYTIPKHETIQIPVETPNSKQSIVPPFAKRRPQPKGEQRMLAALVLKDDSIWSFKGIGPPSVFPSDAKEQFEQLLKSLEFVAPDKPTWELSPRWQEQGPSNMRTATLILDDLEFSVIQSSRPSPDETVAILLNVNRWREQLELPRIEASDLNEATRTISTRDHRDAIVLDIQTATSKQKRPDGATVPRRNEITSKPPKGWKSEQPGSMQRVRYSVEGDSGTAEVSISRAGGPILLNVNRWRGQVGLPPLENEAELKFEDITISDQPGLFAEFYGEGEESTVIAMIPATAPQWFFKMKGSTDVVKQQVAAFRQFLTTVKIKQ